MRFIMQPYNNPKAIHTNSSLSIDVLWSELLHVCKKHPSLRHLTLNYCYNISFSIETSSCWIGREICTDQYCLQAKTVQNHSKQICWKILVWEDNRGWTFSLDEAILYIMDSQTRNVLLLKMFIDGLMWCWLLWYFYQMFWYFHPFPTEDHLVSNVKWCNANILQICSDEDSKSSTYWRVRNCAGNLDIWITYSFNAHLWFSKYCVY